MGNLTIATAITIALVLLASAPALEDRAGPGVAQATTPHAYLPLVFGAPAATATLAPPTATSAPPTATPSATPTLRPTLPPTLNACQADPLALQAPEFPVQIVTINKQAETVTIQNLSSATIDLTNWTMCSILANQQHPISGQLGPGETRTFDGPAANIWNNIERDDGALYDPEGRLVSYFEDL